MNNIVTERFITLIQKLKKDGSIKSLRQFAIALDYLPQSLSEIIKGRRDVTIELLRKAVDVYEFNPNYLFLGKGDYFLNKKAISVNSSKGNLSGNGANNGFYHIPIDFQGEYQNSLSNETGFEDLPICVIPNGSFFKHLNRSFEVPENIPNFNILKGDCLICSLIDKSIWSKTLIENVFYIFVTASQGVTYGKVVVVNNDNIIVNCLIKNTTLEFEINDVLELWYPKYFIASLLKSKADFGQLSPPLLLEIEVLSNIVMENNSLIKSLIVNQTSN
ncbi:MAG: helix-turn-helix transcriptional regulator [Saprospiraceae bacterium]|nr:helix-turn-helix transcriptional regulator [Saprospiraceae bacterium]